MIIMPARFGIGRWWGCLAGLVTATANVPPLGINVHLIFRGFTVRVNPTGLLLMQPNLQVDKATPHHLHSQLRR